MNQVWIKRDKRDDSQSSNEGYFAEARAPAGYAKQVAEQKLKLVVTKPEAPVSSWLGNFWW